jgi:hypothetical protein
MTSLAAWQDAFTAYLQDGTGEAGLCARIGARNIAPELRLDVYRNAYYTRLEQALAHDFPVLLALLGDHDFGRWMADYLRAHPSTSPTLRDLGHALPAWLRAKGKAEHADLAGVEWAVLNACDAADAPLLDQAALAQILPAHWASLRVHLHPSLTLLALDSNAAAFWLAQRAPAAHLALAPSAWNWLAVARGAHGPALINLTEAQHAVLAHLQHGENVAAVCAAITGLATPREIPTQVAETLARAAASGWVCAMA